MLTAIIIAIESVMILALWIKIFLMEGEQAVQHSLYWRQQDSIWFMKNKIAELYKEIGKEYEEEVMVWQTQRRR